MGARIETVQVDARLTTPIELRVCCSRSPSIRGAENRSGRCSRTAAFSTACTVELQTPLPPSCRAAACRGEPAAPAAPRTVLAAPSSKESGYARAPRAASSRSRGSARKNAAPVWMPEQPRVASIDECTDETRSRGGPFVPATDLAVLPPRSSFRRFFARRCSRTIELDRIELDEGSLHRAQRPRAARRLLQPKRSTSTTVTDPNSAHHDGGLPPSQLFSRMAATGPLPHGRGTVAANRCVTGQGSRPRRYVLLDPTPLVAIARTESFAPPRSARTPLVASSWRRRMELPVAARAPLPASVASLP
jgi:hypothetical protein